ncbi:MAG: rhodanese-like domain-containing protein [Candidatus Puniceispirillaceae bacterium]
MMKEANPQDCYEMLQNDAKALLIDCRATIEWQLLGTPNLDSIGKKALLIEWTSMSNQLNTNFVDNVSTYASKDTPIIIMCRIGGRSAAAAQSLIEAGYTDVTNMTEGYEGRTDENGHRNSIEGWRARGLPWHQS